MWKIILGDSEKSGNTILANMKRRERFGAAHQVLSVFDADHHLLFIYINRPHLCSKIKCFTMCIFAHFLVCLLIYSSIYAFRKREDEMETDYPFSRTSLHS